MLNLPLQCAPIQRGRVTRSRVTRSSVATWSGHISGSEFGNPLVAPFASGYTVGPSLIGIMGIPIAPFAREAADG
jgi:hypothetical protein